MNDGELCYIPLCCPLSTATRSAINVASASEMAAAYAFFIIFIIFIILNPCFTFIGA